MWNSFYNNNNNITNTVLLFLTKPTLNLFFICIIFAVMFKIFLNKNYFMLFFIFIKKNSVSSNVNVPLSNTLFLFHPIFFFKFWVYILFFITKNSLKSINILSFIFIFFVLFLGGYWSLQEFNWGGWWNWDILEIFSLLLVVNLIFFFHIRNQSKINKNNHLFQIINYATFYYFINKTGFNSSIHSFVKSSTLSNNIQLINFLFVIFLSTLVKKNKFFCLYLIIFIFFIFFKNFFFLKSIIFFSYLCYFFFRKKKTKKLNNFLHKLYLMFGTIIYIFNYQNSSFLFCAHLNFLKNHEYIFWNKILLQKFTHTNQINYYYCDFFLFKLNNLFQNNFFVFFLKKLFYSKIKGFIFF